MSALERRLARCALTDDHDLVLDPGAILESAELLEATGDLLSGSNTLALVGMLHFLRFVARPDNEEEPQVATMFFAPLVDSAPELVPGSLREILTQIRQSKPARDDDPARAAVRSALTATPPATSAWADVLRQLSIVLYKMSERARDGALLGEAAAVLRHAIATAGADDPRRPRWLSDLASMTQARFRQVRDTALLAADIDALRQAAEDSTHPDHAELLFSLGSSLFEMYRQTGQSELLAEALDVDRRAVAETPPSDERHLTRLANLAISLLAWYDETGQASDLDQTLRDLHAAFARSADDPVRQPYVLAALGSALHHLYDRTGDIDALADAITAHRVALSGLPPEHPLYLQEVINLAGVLLARYVRTEDRSSLDEAVTLLRAASSAAGFTAGSPAAGSPTELATFANTFSIALLESFGLSRNEAELDEAIAQARRAVGDAATPPERRATHGTLGRALMTRYLWSADRGPFGGEGPARAAEALAELRAAVKAAPHDDPGRAASLANLGNALLAVCDADTYPKRAKRAAKAGAAFRLAAASRLAPARIKVEAGVAGGRLAADHGDWSSAAASLAAAVGALELALPRSLRRSDREHQLKRLRDLPADAAAAARLDGDPTRAATLFEQGRGVLLAQAMHSTTDLERLHARQPGLHQQFVRLRQEIDHVASDPGPGLKPAAADLSWTGLTTAEMRTKLAGSWDDLIGEIRALSGFTSFLLPPQTADLVAAAESGPIAMIYASKYGSAALVIRSTGVDAVDLPGLSQSAVRAAVAELLTIFGPDIDTMTERNRRMMLLLEWLWDAIAGPVLDHIGRVGRLDPAADGPRIWWCPSGLLSFLPLHAAGHHETRSSADPQTVMDRVISSYAPTVRVLMHARRQAIPVGQAATEPPTTLIVCQDDDLPGAADEADSLAIKVAAKIIKGRRARRQAVLGELERYRRVHFACHAFSDIDDPSAGYLKLHDHESAPLTVRDVAALRLERAEFAFLSACSTYRGGAALADEAIHLGSAFQLAGYPHVIATLWPINGAGPRRIAQTVHENVARADGLAATARALHLASRRERNLDPGRPLLWAAHVHSGI